MQERVLLRAAEAVYLVDEQYRSAVVGHEAPLRLVDFAPKVLDRTRNRRDLDELAARMLRDDVGERGLARPRRAVEDDAREHVVLDGRPEPAPRTHRLFLTDVLVERRRPHTHGERRVVTGAFALLSAEQSLHRHPYSFMYVRRGNRISGK